MAPGVIGTLAGAGATLYGAAWEVRRRAYARGWLKPRHVETRVVSIGNLSVGGTGKTTLTLRLARLGLERGRRCAVVCRSYQADRAGMSDEAYLYRRELEDGTAKRVYVGPRKVDETQAAAAAGCDLVLVDDAFSTWSLDRDLDVVLLDARDLWGGGALLPAGRLREPRRALQRAQVVVVSRLAAGEDPAPYLAEVRAYAPAASVAAGRHAVRDVVPWRPDQPPTPSARVRVVTGTGNPHAVAATAREAGLDVVSLARYRDHHWFRLAEVRRELERARVEDAAVLLTEKDAVRWIPERHPTPVLVLRAAWEWVVGGESVEQRVLGTVR